MKAVMGHDLSATCPFCNKCHFFNAISTTSNRAALKHLFCDQFPRSCEIYQRLIFKQPLSASLWPTGRECAVR